MAVFLHARTYVWTPAFERNKNACKVGARMQMDTANSKAAEAINVAPDSPCE